MAQAKLFDDVLGDEPPPPRAKLFDDILDEPAPPQLPDSTLEVAAPRDALKKRAAPRYKPKPSDQSIATGLEKASNFLGDISTHRAAGATRALIQQTPLEVPREPGSYDTWNPLQRLVDTALEQGQRILEGQARGVEKNTTFGDVFTELIPPEKRDARIVLPARPGIVGRNGPIAPAGEWKSPTLETAVRLGPGLAGDVLTDVTNVLGVGATSAGKVIKANRAAKLAARLSGDTQRIAATQNLLTYVPKDLSGRLRAGQAGFQFMGKTIAPAAQADIIKALESIPDVKVGNQLLRETVAGKVAKAVLEKSDKTVRGLFLARPELRGAERDVFLHNMAQTKAAMAIAEREFDEATKPLRDRIHKTAAKLGIGSDNLVRVMANVVETADPNSYIETERAITKAFDIFEPRGSRARRKIDYEMSSDMYDLVDTINMWNSRAIARTKAAGVPISELPGPLQYMRRQMMPSARQILNTIPRLKGIARDVSETHSEMFMRGFDPTLTTTQINDLAKAGALTMDVDGVPVAIPALPDGLFFEDPFVATAFRVKHGEQAVGNAEMLKSWVKEFGERVPNADELVEQSIQAGKAMTKQQAEQIVTQARHDMLNKGLAAVDNKLVRGSQWVKGQIPEGEFYLPEDIAAAFNRNHLALQNSEVADQLTQYLDDSHRIWKKYTLGIFPAYHTRNIVGDMWNAFVLGGANPKWMKAGFEASHGFLDPTKEIVLNGKKWKMGDLFDVMDRHGVIDGGQIRELENRLSVMRTRPASLLGKVGSYMDENAILDMGMRVGAARENGTRAAVFIDRMAKGWDPAAAAIDVKKYLFDYTELSDIEKNVLRRWMPFYSWTRKNVPLQFQHLFQKPGAFSNVQHLREEAGGESGIGLPNDAPMMRFLRQGHPLRVGSNPVGNPQYARLEGYWPGTDANVPMAPLDGGAAILNRLIAMQSPITQTAYEIGFNQDTFKSDFPGRQPAAVEAFPGEQERLLGLPMRKQVSGAIKTAARPVAELDRLLGPWINKHFFGESEREAASGVTRLLTLLGVGRSYAVDPDKQQRTVEHGTDKNYWTVRGKDRIAWLQTRAKWAKRNGDTKNAKILEELIDKEREAMR